MEKAHAPTVPQLRALVAVADTRHFGEAAARLGTSQPSVSAAVSGLERTLAVPLVERSTRKVLLTPVGEAVATEARGVLDSLDHLVDLAEGGGRPFCGPLRLGVIPTVGPYVLAPLLAAVEQRHPLLRPEVTEAQTAQLLEDLAAGRLEVAVMALPSGASDMIEIPLYDEDFVLLLAEDHPLAGRTDLAQPVLRDLPLLLLEEGHCLRDQALEVCRQAGADTVHSARATSLPTIAQLVAAGLGATLLPATAVTVEAPKGRLRTATFARPAPGRRIGLVHRPTSTRAAEDAELADTIRAGLRRASLPIKLTAST
jgi:LysR family transcriptional regulator, hydrogen peroxide-inducible genes activator